MKKTIIVYIFALFLVSFLINACNNASTTSENITSDADTVVVESDDEEIANESATEAVDLVLLTYMNNRLQHEMGKVAVEQASSEGVREVAQSVMNASEEARVKLEELAQTANTDLPEAIGVDQKMKLDSINNLSQEQFDKAYLTEVVEEMKENNELLNKLIEEGDNPITAGVVDDIKNMHEEQMRKAESLLEELS